MSDELFRKEAEHQAELMGLTTERFCERLRGLIRIPINDGAGPLNGSNEFVRQFQVGPINHEAARRIEALSTALQQEREECAKIAENSLSHDDSLHIGCGLYTTGQRIAKAIRSRSSGTSNV